MGLLVAAYICHIMGGGIFKSYRNDTVSVVIIEVIESSSLFLAICLFTEDVAG